MSTAGDPTVRAIEPLTGPIDAVVMVPGSKSISNRALIGAALAEGESTIVGALDADDTEAMIQCLRRLGRDVRADGDTLFVSGGSFQAGPMLLDARLSGTTARFLLPALSLGEGRYTVDGRPPLRARPMHDLVVALRTLGVRVDEDGEPGHLPLTVTGGGSTGGTVRVRGDVTSQYLSALLLSGPRFEKGLVVDVTGGLVSRPYVELTIAVMADLGVVVEATGSGWRVPPAAYRPATLAVEPDASAASYFFAAAAICGGRVTVPGLHRDSVQGDAHFVDILRAMGATVEERASGLSVHGTRGLRGGEFDLRDMPDMAQTLAVVAAFADGPTTVKGVGFIRGHETDRIAAVVRELKRCGIEATEEPDGFVVKPGRIITGATIETYDDHRMAMSFALLGLRVPGIGIANPECAAKTFPGYWDALDGMRGRRG